MAKGMKGMLKQAQKMQKEMMKLQEDVATRSYDGSASGGLVKLQLDGNGELTKLTIDPEAVDPEDVEMLEDLIMAAFKTAKDAQSKDSNDAFGSISEGMNIPGLM